MAARSQELAPNLWTFAGNPADAPSASGKTESPGTQTMCMSECTSMPAAWGLRMGSATACSRGGRDAGFGGVLALAASTFDDLALLTGERLRWLMVSALFLEWGEDSRRGPRGEQEKCNLPNGINASMEHQSRNANTTRPKFTAVRGRARRGGYNVPFDFTTWSLAPAAPLCFQHKA